MGKRKSPELLLQEEARKTVREAPKRSLEYKEAKKLIDDSESKDVESDAESEDDSDTPSESSEEEEEEEEEASQKVVKRGGKRAKVEPVASSSKKKKAVTKKSIAGNHDKVYFFRCDEKAVYPMRASMRAAGFDLFSTEKELLKPGKTTLIETHIQVTMPVGTYGRIALRSGLASYHGIFVEAGVVDPDYGGTLKVLLYNSSEDEYLINEHERVGQLILEKYSDADPVFVDTALRQGESEGK